MADPPAGPPFPPPAPPVAAPGMILPVSNPLVPSAATPVAPYLAMPMPATISPPVVAGPTPPIAPLPIRVVSQKNEDADGEKTSPSPSPSRKDDAGVSNVFQVSEESKRARERQEQAVQQLLMRRRANALAVPTNDSAVRSRLRNLGHPITLFGEREMERRDRLRTIMAKLDADGDLDKLLKAQEASADGEAEEAHELETIQTKTFYTEGTHELQRARVDILHYSLPKAAARISMAKRKREDPDEDEDAEADYVLKAMLQTSMDCSEIGDERPLSGCAFSPDSSLLATSGWSGITKVWSIPEVKKVSVLKGHTERITAVAFSSTGTHIATASADRTAILWDLEGVRRVTFEGHLDRLARLAFHPSGSYLATTSFDKTWRLWDVATGTELLLQEGHSRSVYGIAFHPDGSLVASCGMDALTRVWDLRTGRSILALEGHVKPVLGIDFSPNGYHLATGSEDHTCRIWDLRKKHSLYIIPAHSSLISQVKYEPQEGYFLVTASYDNTARIWSSRDFKPIKTLAGHEGKVMGIDITSDGHQIGEYIATVSYDRTIKLWSHNKPTLV